MRNVIYAALLLSAPAGAQPVMQPHACQVTIARAPDDVREVVETWVRSEAQCSTALEIRIVPTEGGLYLLARDEHGGVRERIVPDAQTAGVLVASWIADDNAPAPAPAPPPRPVAPPAPAAESISPPGLAPIAIAAATTTAPAASNKWAAVAALASMADGGGGGIRGEIDLWSRGRWFVGAAASLTESQQTMLSVYGSGYITANDLKAMAYVARPLSRGRWQLRPAVGLGIIKTRGLVFDGYGSYYDVAGTFPTAEASLVLSRELGTQWAVYTGPLVTLLEQQYDVSTSSYPMTISRGDADVVWLAGLRHRL